jgi:hypothetical protein
VARRIYPFKVHRGNNRHCPRFLTPVNHTDFTRCQSIPSPVGLGLASVCQCISSPFALSRHPHHSFNWTNTFHISPMAMPGPSTFQSTFSHALRVYKERVKIDLLLHPLAVQLQLCDSSHAVISVLQEQAGAIDQSLKKVLHPTVNAIYAFSSSLQGFGMVYICACSFGTCPVHSFSRYYPQRKSYLLASVSS